MAKVKVEVTGANVDGHAPGSTISIEEKSADYFEQLGYVKKLKAEPKPKSKPKKSKQAEEPKADKDDE